MAKQSNSLLVAAAFACGLLSCSYKSILVPNPPAQTIPEKQEKPVAPVIVEQEKPPAIPESSVQDSDTVDFSLAFGEGPPALLPETPVKTGRLLTIGQTNIRIALRRNIASAVFYTMGEALVWSSTFRSPLRFRGRLLVEAKGNGLAAIIPAGGRGQDAALPCTLSAAGLLSLDEKQFRGSMIIQGDDKISIINSCSVEEYLRGVVPLEIGRLKNGEAEALKAQAIAARTYAYKRMSVRNGQLFDVVATVADHVYGGAYVETDEADQAIRATKNLVLAYGDSLCTINYHSTCGGRTADVSEVWNRLSQPYLRSVKDTAPDGTAYCAFSPAFSWEESWSGEEISGILRAAGAKDKTGRFAGSLRAIRVTERFACGRVKTCVLDGSKGSIECHGDNVRFILRTDDANGQILRSANFTVTQNGPHRFTLQGKGYGHGVGMCQMGAIGRARSGQKCDEILKAYFTGAVIQKLGK